MRNAVHTTPVSASPRLRTVAMNLADMAIRSVNGGASIKTIADNPSAFLYAVSGRSYSADEKRVINNIVNRKLREEFGDIAV